MNRFSTIACTGLVALALSGGVARAQQTPASPAPAPARSTVVSRQYDGKTHVTLSPYIWLPTVNGNFAYKVPRLPSTGGAGLANVNIQVGPNAYLAKINFAFMGAFDVRKGDVDAFGDFINLNGSAGSAYVSSVTGPLGHLTVPVYYGIAPHLASTIWELGTGYTFFHSDDFSTEGFIGYRNVSVSPKIGYNFQVGNTGLVMRNGTLVSKDEIGAVIFGMKGTLALGDGNWYIPYYADWGQAATGQTWQAYAGIGRATRGGSFLLALRELNYDLAPGVSAVQKIRFGGPLLGYSFQI